jgi:hypothetical protein
MKQGNAKGFYDRINESAFDNFGGNNYDPDYSDGFQDVQNGYDPDYAGESVAGAATRTEQSSPGQKMQINIDITNPTASKQKVELFSAFNSWADIFKPEYVVAAHTAIPQLSTEGLATVGVGTIGYDQNGNLHSYGAALAASVSIGCGEYPYKSLVESTKTLPFRNNFLRIAVTTVPQLNNQLVHFTQTFAGGYKENKINVRSYKTPNQFQNLEVDTKTPFIIDGEKGLKYSLEIGETVQIGMFINRWSRPTV